VICPRCRRREAVVFIKRIEDNRVSEVSLCAECAQESAAEAGGGSHLFGLLAQLGGLAKAGPGREREPACPACGLKWSQFRRTGMLGCPDCWTRFERPLGELLPRIHGFARHAGKAPGRSRGPALRKKLQAALRAEDFEEAARLRERLRELGEGG
jgi:protein arginine kinase activator